MELNWLQASQTKQEKKNYFTVLWQSVGNASTRGRCVKKQMKPSARLLKLLKPPAQLANALDWKKQSKKVASLHIGRDRIGVAIASHPMFGEDVTMLHPLNLDLVKMREDSNQRTVSPACVERLERICETHNVGSFLVWWPLQKEGRVGAPCGKVIHALESIITQSDVLMSPQRPVSLWTGEETAEEALLREQYVEDEWGRASVYARCCYDKTIHLASIEQYGQVRGCSTAAAACWKTFCKHHWPLKKGQRGIAKIAKVRQSHRISDLPFCSFGSAGGMAVGLFHPLMSMRLAST